MSLSIIVWETVRAEDWSRKLERFSNRLDKALWSNKQMWDHSKLKLQLDCEQNCNLASGVAAVLEVRFSRPVLYIFYLKCYTTAVRRFFRKLTNSLWTVVDTNIPRSFPQIKYLKTSLRKEKCLLAAVLATSGVSEWHNSPESSWDGSANTCYIIIDNATRGVSTRTRGEQLQLQKETLKKNT